MVNDSQNGSFRFRPAGRHLLTIGRDLIQDKYAAISELIKNAYDADSHNVTIDFSSDDSRGKIVIQITDDGHGMSPDTIVNKWLVPSTDDKLKRIISPSGRLMQGKKGIGRYAAAILGEELFLESIADGVKTSALVPWDKFASNEFLDQIEILIESHPTSAPNGTKLTITATDQALYGWDEAQYKKLIYELRKITPPNNILNDKASEFYVSVKRHNFIEEGDGEEFIKPFPVFDLFDYKIAGEISEDGKVVAKFETNKLRATGAEDVVFLTEEKQGCGRIVFDIRVFDRDGESIDELIGRGLDEKGGNIGRREARRILDKSNGIGVYRNGFRIRPLGDPANDWLELNKIRVQNPSKKIGSDQVIGHVLIQAETESGLIEKSARDGLKDNPQFNALIKRTQEVIGQLEWRRFEIRRKLDLGKNDVKVGRDISGLFSFDPLKRRIDSELKRLAVAESSRKEILEIIEKEERRKFELAESIQVAFAVYQGQATLGKIINVVLHEGRRPLNYFKNQVPNLREWSSRFSQDRHDLSLEKIVSISNGIASSGETFVQLFSRIDPLATSSRGKKTAQKIGALLNDSFRIFNEELISKGIQFDVSGDLNCELVCWRQDIVALLVNLIENSIYWIVYSQKAERSINVSIQSNNGEFDYLDFLDSGSGIEAKLLENNLIFEPNFSTRPNGTGLGLSIAGEAASRNGLDLTALAKSDGAHFRLQKSDE